MTLNTLEKFRHSTITSLHNGHVCKCKSNVRRVSAQMTVRVVCIYRIGDHYIGQARSQMFAAIVCTLNRDSVFSEWLTFEQT